MSPQNGKSIKDFRAGKIQVSIWCNEIQKDGDSRIRHAIRIPKDHRKGHGNCKATGCDRPEELPQLAAAVQEAFEYVVLMGNKAAEEVAT